MGQDSWKKSARILLLSAKELLEPLKRDNLSGEDKKKYDELSDNIKILNKN